MSNHSMSQDEIDTLLEGLEKSNESVFLNDDSDDLDIEEETKTATEFKHTCPLCKSTNTEDSSSYSDNGIMGPGYSSWITFEAYHCLECGILFKPINKQDKNNE